MAGRGDEALLRADVPAIHVFLAVTKPGRGSPGQARWWRRCSGRLLSVMAGEATKQSIFYLAIPSHGLLRWRSQW